jgi:dynein heavy chain 2
MRACVRVWAARESLLGQLDTSLETMREDFENRSGMATGRGARRVGKNLPDSVEHLVLARQVGDKVGELLSAAKMMLYDLQGMAKFEVKATDLQQFMTDYQQQMFSEWVQKVEADLKDDSSGLALQLTGKLMEINQEDLSLQVNYSDRLIVFLREVRQLSALGFRMPEQVKWNADVAHKFYRHAVVLKQVANFYNTIEKQIVRSQKPLLLDHALQFEKLATNPTAKTAGDRGGGKTITWSDPNLLESYIQHLHAAAERLTQENRKLRQVHSKMGEQVTELMHVSLLRQQNKWKEKVEALRQMADALQPHYPGMKGWRLHWDMQLFKALEHQYQVGLEGLHQDLKEIKCKLVFEGRKLQLRPALEELRMDFHREIKKFISIPTGFKGLGYFDEVAKDGAGEGRKELGKHKVYKIFRDMQDRNVESLLVVYQKAGELFNKLEAVLAKYRCVCSSASRPRTRSRSSSRPHAGHAAAFARPVSRTAVGRAPHDHARCMAVRARAWSPVAGRTACWACTRALWTIWSRSACVRRPSTTRRTSSSR